MADRSLTPALRRLHTVLKCSDCGSEIVVPPDQTRWPWCCGRPLLIKGWSYEQLHGRPFQECGTADASPTGVRPTKR